MKKSTNHIMDTTIPLENPYSESIAQRERKKKLADDHYARQMEIKLRIGSVRRRKVPVTLAGPKFKD